MAIGTNGPDTRAISIMDGARVLGVDIVFHFVATDTKCLGIGPSQRGCTAGHQNARDKQATQCQEGDRDPLNPNDLQELGHECGTAAH
jgi:hypothetical protein